MHGLTPAAFPLGIVLFFFFSIFFLLFFFSSPPPLRANAKIGEVF